MGHVSKRIGLILLTLTCAAPAGADLESDLYSKAKSSKRMQSLSTRGEDLSAFLGPGRPKANVAVLLHDAGCPHCRHALPELDIVAAELGGEPLAIGHVDCTTDKQYMKERFNLRGFPALFFFRRPEAPSAATQEPLINKTYVVDSDADFLRRASRLAGLGEGKDAARVRLLGQTVVAREVDLKDRTVQVEDGRSLVWLPEEALLSESGARLPYRRAEAMAAYVGRWDKIELQRFLTRLMRPLVSPLQSLTQLSVQGMEDERAPALVFCGPTLTPGFLEVAVAHQLQSRAFHAPDPAECPVPLKVRSGSQLVVYSPASQQWSTTPNGAKAAVAVAGSQIVASDASLVAWAACHRYPGITSLGYKNFQDWLRTNRSSLLVAVNVHSSNKDVERRLKETGNPRGIGAMEEYTYKPSDHDLGVADGKLEGLSYFGVNYRDLPRVVVFEDANTWVEDITELTLDRLNLDLMKVPSLWRMSGSFKGHVLWALKELRWNYRYYDDLASSKAGNLGRAMYHLLLASAVFGQIGMLYAIVTSLKEAIVGEQAKEAAKVEKKTH